MNEVNINNNKSTIHLGQIMESHIKEHYTNEHREIVVLCIGTDRCTGDSLGPLTGHKLEKRIKGFKDVYLHGTLEEPVHAKNLGETIDLIKYSYKNPFVIAIDACLGNINRIGCIKVSNGPLKPGAGVNKDLPLIGDINVLGIVNLAGFMEFMMLQNTRLSLVMKMADGISRSIEYALWKITKEIENQSYNYSNQKALNGTYLQN